LCLSLRTHVPSSLTVPSSFFLVSTFFTSPHLTPFYTQTPSICLIHFSCIMYTQGF
jgi:hypothetical protein